MRIWDINPGYLNRQSLLGEHRELHGIVSILVNRKKGYARHPETMRWADFGWALRLRHQLLAAEMALRGYKDQSPVQIKSNEGKWPRIYIDQPDRQFAILGVKYLDKEPGRIPLPVNAQELWSQHKYSVLARNPELYRRLGKELVRSNTQEDFVRLARLVSELLRQSPSLGGLANALQHMWGYVNDIPARHNCGVENWPLSRLLEEIQIRSLDQKVPYLLSSTALSELKVWLPDSQNIS